MGSELQSGKFINPSQDAQEDGVEKVAVKDRTIVFKILQGWRVTHVYIINLTFVQHTCLCENRICATEQGVMTENMKQVWHCQFCELVYYLCTFDISKAMLR